MEVGHTLTHSCRDVLYTQSERQKLKYLVPASVSVCQSFCLRYLSLSPWDVIYVKKISSKSSDTFFIRNHW